MIRKTNNFRDKILGLFCINELNHKLNVAINYFMIDHEYHGVPPSILWTQLFAHQNYMVLFEKRYNQETKLGYLASFSVPFPTENVFKYFYARKNNDVGAYREIFSNHETIGWMPIESENI